jgi:hypothetical protein
MVWIESRDEKEKNKQIPKTGDTSAAIGSCGWSLPVAHPKIWATVPCVDYPGMDTGLLYFGMFPAW